MGTGSSLTSVWARRRRADSSFRIAGEEVVVSGTIREIAPIPRPGTVPVCGPHHCRAPRRSRERTGRRERASIRGVHLGNAQPRLAGSRTVSSRRHGSPSSSGRGRMWRASTTASTAPSWKRGRAVRSRRRGARWSTNDITRSNLTALRNQPAVALSHVAHFVPRRTATSHPIQPRSSPSGRAWLGPLSSKRPLLSKAVTGGCSSAPSYGISVSASSGVSRASRVSKARRPEWADPLPGHSRFSQTAFGGRHRARDRPRAAEEHHLPGQTPFHCRPRRQPPPRLDLHHQAFYELLRENGVRVLGPHPYLPFQSARAPNGPLYCLQDTHWSGVATVLAAEQIAAHVRSKPWFETVPKNTFQQEMENSGDCRRPVESVRRALPSQRTSLRCVLSGPNPSGALIPLEPDPSSPVILLGDSHTLVFHAGDDMHAEGAGLADQLALELGFAVDLVGVRGSGATAARINLLTARSANTPTTGPTRSSSFGVLRPESSPRATDGEKFRLSERSRAHRRSVRRQCRLLFQARFQKDVRILNHLFPVPK